MGKDLVARNNSGTRSMLDPVMQEALDRFKRVDDRESDFNKLFWEDIKWAIADSDNNYQWPNDIRQTRELNREPSLTVNKIRQHCLQIINDARQNTPGIKYRPTGGGATFEAAQVWEGLARHIEYISQAAIAYNMATSFQVKGGLGYIFVTTGYPDDESFDQEIYIGQCPDPLKVRLDCDIKKFDGSDAKFGFIFEDVQRDEFDLQYPEYAEHAGSQSALDSPTDWQGDNYIRVANYFRKVRTKDVLVSFIDPDSGERKQIHKSKIPPDVADLVIADPDSRTRDVWREKVEWNFIIGETVVESGEFPSKYIPIVRVVGEETFINGVLDRKGHVRNLRDPQRMYNYWTSSATAQVALQTKTPFIAPAQAIEGFEVQWRTANTQNYSVLPYNHRDDDGNEIPPPQRSDAPQMAQAYTQGMQIAVNEMAMASGQYSPTMGEPSNERSAKAINERQRAGDNSTYHFIDNLGVAIRFLGEIIKDMIPRVYDTPRVIRILNEDGTDFELQLDPQAQQLFAERMDHNGKVVARVLNPKLGKFDVEADIGPNYGTQRQEAFNAISLILSQNPGLTSIIGDILFRAADFPGADEVAARLKRMVPPNALGQGPSQAEQQLTQQLQTATQALTQALEKLAAQTSKNKSKDELRDIDAYKAETDRLKVLIGKISDDQGLMLQLMQQLKGDTAATQIGEVSDKTEQDLGVEQPPAPGAKKATDGNWYLPHPTQPGAYLQVMPQGQGSGGGVPQ